MINVMTHETNAQLVGLHIMMKRKKQKTPLEKKNDVMFAFKFVQDRVFIALIGVLNGQ